jgi:hypothetical protein
VIFAILDLWLTPTMDPGPTCEPYIFADYVSPDHTCYAPAWVGECDVETMEVREYDPSPLRTSLRPAPQADRDLAPSDRRVGHGLESR